MTVLLLCRIGGVAPIVPVHVDAPWVAHAEIVDLQGIDRRQRHLPGVDAPDVEHRRIVRQDVRGRRQPGCEGRREPDVSLAAQASSVANDGTYQRNWPAARGDRLSPSGAGQHASQRRPEARGAQATEHRQWRTGEQGVMDVGAVILPARLEQQVDAEEREPGDDQRGALREPVAPARPSNRQARIDEGIPRRKKDGPFTRRLDHAKCSASRSPLVPHPSLRTTNRCATCTASRTNPSKPAQPSAWCIERRADAATRARPGRRGLQAILA